MPSWEALVGLVVGGVLVMAGLLAWSGRWRSWAQVRQNSYLPAWIRNGPSVTIPAGMALTLMCASMVLMRARNGLDIVGAVLFVASLVGLMASGVLMRRPPHWLKARWLEEEEQQAGGIAPPAP